MQEEKIIARIKQLCDARGWSVYRLAKESDITYSTLNSMLHKPNSPSIPTLIKICDGFGITLSQFFDVDNDTALLSTEEKYILSLWKSLDKESRRVAEKHLQFLFQNQASK